MKVKEENENVGLKLNIQKTKIMASGPNTSWQIDGETMETLTDFISWAPKSLLLNCGVGEDSWEPLGLQGDPTSPSYRKSVLNIHWKNWCWSWNSSPLATWYEEQTHWKRPWCWERLKVGGDGDNRGWDGWMASLTWWTWVWVSSGSWWWTGKPGMLQSMGLQRVGHKWVWLNWTELTWKVRCQIGSWISEQKGQERSHNGDEKSEAISI